MADGILKVGQITNSAGSGNITIGSGVTLLSNVPAFFVYLGSNQSVSDGVYTKIQFNTELLDTDNAYDNSTNYRFTPQTAGNYFISVNIMSDYSNTTNIQDTVIYKNGDKFLRSYVDNRGQNTYNQSTNISGIVSFNGSSDYIEGFTRVDVGSGTPELSGSSSSPLQHYTYMYGYRIGA